MNTDEEDIRKQLKDFEDMCGKQPSEEYAMAEDKEFWMYRSGRADGFGEAVSYILFILFPEERKEPSEAVKALMEASYEMYLDMRNKPKVFELEDMVL